VPWKNPDDEARCLLFALHGKEGPVSNLILYNAALRLWVADEDTPLEDHVNKARETLLSGSALRLLEQLRQPLAASRLGV
jgi:anthranilate phosphoribosyltransferase